VQNKTETRQIILPGMPQETRKLLTDADRVELARQLIGVAQIVTSYATRYKRSLPQDTRLHSDTHVMLEHTTFELLAWQTLRLSIYEQLRTLICTSEDWSRILREPGIASDLHDLYEQILRDAPSV
jgi:hypothetical protein